MSFTFSTSLMASNYAGHTKKTTASGIIFVGWAAGLIAGPRESGRAARIQALSLCFPLTIFLFLSHRLTHLPTHRMRGKVR